MGFWFPFLPTILRGALDVSRAKKERVEDENGWVIESKEKGIRNLLREVDMYMYMERETGDGRQEEETEGWDWGWNLVVWEGDLLYIGGLSD